MDSMNEMRTNYTLGAGVRVRERWSVTDSHTDFFRKRKLHWEPRVRRNWIHLSSYEMYETNHHVTYNLAVIQLNSGEKNNFSFRSVHVWMDSHEKLALNDAKTPNKLTMRIDLAK